MTDEQRLSELRRLLMRIQFDHLDQRARLIDEFYSEEFIDNTAPLVARIKKVYLYALNRRTFWAQRDGEASVARAVAYQSIAGDLIRVLDEDLLPEGRKT